MCGKVGRRNYAHRKKWLTQRIKHLAQFFSLEVYAYAIMSNHFHLVVYYEPKAALSWSDETIAQRWTDLCPPRSKNGDIDTQAKADLFDKIIQSPRLLNQKRQALGSLSVFMKFLKQPIAYRANQEDGCSGHFFEQRFYSGVLLDETAMIDAMAYVDLNPVRAKLARYLEEIEHTSVSERLRANANSKQRLDEVMSKLIEPVAGGLEAGSAKFRPTITPASYAERLRQFIRIENAKTKTDKELRWLEHIQMFKRRQRAYGPAHLLNAWNQQRGFQMREVSAA